MKSRSPALPKPPKRGRKTPNLTTGLAISEEEFAGRGGAEQRRSCDGVGEGEANGEAPGSVVLRPFNTASDLG